ncbi:MAG: DICT sensory domain-containing protein [Halobacteriales archaeon]
MSKDPVPASLSQFIDRVGASEWAVQIVNRTAPDAIEEMLEDLFDGLTIDMTEEQLQDTDDDMVLLLNEGEPVASSPLSIVRDTLLLVNSDLYKTGTADIENIDPPDIILELADTVFSVRGFPESNIEKLVLTLISRYIEHQAWSRETGTLRSSFQRLSRLDDEQGTRRVYERLGQLPGLDVHAYGLPDWDPPEEMGLNIHEVTDDEIMQHWFVVYQTSTGQNAAMLAVKSGLHEWDGYWTFDQSQIRSMNEYITQTF